MLKTLQNLRNSCDYVIQYDVLPGERPRPLEAFLPLAGSLKAGAVVYVKTDLLDRFFALAFPRITTPFVLVTAGSGQASPGPFQHYLDDIRIIRWFGQNPDIDHPKFEPLPIGFMDACWAPGNQEALLHTSLMMPAVSEKPLKAIASFQFNKSHLDRAEVLKIVREMPHVDVVSNKLPPTELWMHHSDYAFEISPRGSGFDCHRTWEAILLRTIPIVKSSYADRLYSGFPVAIVKDWRDITPHAMAAWREQFKDAFTEEMFERLTLLYWLKRLYSSQASRTESLPHSESAS